MNVHHLVEFIVTVAVLIALPGPSVLFVISRGVTLGRRAALVTVLGNAGGLSLQVLLVAFGLGSLLADSQVLLAAVRLAGSAYLVFLGVQMIRHRRLLATLADATAEPRSARRILREGFVVGATNPKGLIIFTAVLSQFIDPGSGAIQLQLAGLGAICIAIALISDSAWAIASGTVRSRFRRSARSLECINGVGGLVVIGLGLRLGLSGYRR